MKTVFTVAVFFCSIQALAIPVAFNLSVEPHVETCTLISSDTIDQYDCKSDLNSAENIAVLLSCDLSGTHCSGSWEKSYFVGGHPFYFNVQILADSSTGSPKYRLSARASSIGGTSTVRIYLEKAIVPEMLVDGPSFPEDSDRKVRYAPYLILGPAI